MAKTRLVKALGLSGLLVIAWGGAWHAAQSLPVPDSAQIRIDASNTGLSPITKIKPAVVELWHAQTPGISAAPAVAFRGRVYDPEGASGLVAIDKATGLVAWQYQVSAFGAWQSVACRTGSDGRTCVYLTMYSGSTGSSVLCLRDDGDVATLIWVKDYPYYFYTGNLTLSQDTLYYAVQESTATTSVACVALKTENGNPVYHVIPSTAPALYAKPAVDPGTGWAYYATTAGHVICLDAQGNQVFDIPAAGHDYWMPLALDATNRRLYTYGAAPNFYGASCYDSLSGNLLWHTTGYDRPSTLVLANNLVHVSAEYGHALKALDAATGARVWQTPIYNDQLRAVLAAGDGKLWVRGVNADTPMGYYCLDAFTGQMLSSGLLSGRQESTMWRDFYIDQDSLYLADSAGKVVRLGNRTLPIITLGGSKVIATEILELP